MEREYAELFPGEVEAVHVVHDTAPMNSLVKEYAKLKGKLEDLVDDYTSKKRPPQEDQAQAGAPCPET